MIKWLNGIVLLVGILILTPFPAAAANTSVRIHSSPYTYGTPTEHTGSIRRDFASLPVYALVSGNFYEYSTGDSIIENTAKSFTVGGWIQFWNNAQYAIPTLTLTLNSPNASLISSYQSPPCSEKTQQGTTWSWKWVNNSSVTTQANYNTEPSPASLPPGFNCSRSVDTDEFMGEGDQTITVEFTSFENFDQLGWRFGMGGPWTSGETPSLRWQLIEGSPDASVVNPVIGRTYSFTRKLHIVPKISGKVRFVPEIFICGQRDSEILGIQNATNVNGWSTNALGHSVSTSITVSEPANWSMCNNRTLKSITMRELPEPNIARSYFYANPRYVYVTDENSIQDSTLPFASRWEAWFNNVDPTKSVQTVTVTADTANIGPITGTPIPPNSITGSLYTWIFNNILPGTARWAFLVEDRIATLPSGFSCSRQVNKELFSAADNQTVTVTVTGHQPFISMAPLVENLNGQGETDVAKWRVIGPASRTYNSPTVNTTYTCSFTVEVTPKVPGTIRHVPMAGVYVYDNYTPLQGGVAYARTVQAKDFLGRILTATGTASEAIKEFGSWTGMSKQVSFKQVSVQTSQPPVEIPTATGSGTVFCSSNNGLITNATAVAEDTLPTTGKPNVSFPHGLFSYNIVGVTPGSTITVTLTMPASMPIGTQYWKFQNGNWVNCTSILGHDDGDNILTLALTDGWPFDADGVANGTIVDPGGPALPIPNRPPVLAHIDDKTVDEGQLLSFTVSATDPDGNVLTYSASNLPAGANFNGTTKTFSWTPTYVQAGTYPNVHFEVADGKAVASENITITVNNLNRAPVIQSVTADPSQLWPPNKKPVNVKITVVATDPDGASDIVRTRYSVADEYAQYNASETTLPSNGIISLISGRDGNDKDGRVYAITVIVYDAGGLSATNTVNVVVPHDQGK